MKSPRTTFYSAFTLITTALLFLVSNVNAQFPSFPPSNVTSTQDRDQMMWQLGISFPTLPNKMNDPNKPTYLNARPSSSSDPEGNWTDDAGHTITRSGFGLWNNYDDSKTGTYTPIDLLKMKNGTVITTADQWWNQRRPEMSKDCQELMYGIIPDASILPSITWSVTTTTGGSGSSAYRQKVITGTIDISRYPSVRNRPKISATLRTPLNAGGPVPVMIVIGGSIGTYWGYAQPQGWGACAFDYAQLQPDNGAGLTSYIIGLCNQGNWRKPTDWGALAAWAWGVSKLVDYMQTDADVNAAKIGVTGHSRWGKATLVAMAYDQRIAFAFPSCAGSMGTKMNRYHWGQDLENSGWDQEYHWMAGNFFKWMGELNAGSYLPRKIENCPVDAQSMIALCAPRPVFANAGNSDSWNGPYGIYLALKAAGPVYELLGKQGLIMNDAKPLVDVAYISGDLGHRYHNGGHTDSPDWPAFWQFAAKYNQTVTLSVSPTTLSLTAAANSSGTFNVTSNTSWKDSSSQSWLTVSPATGSNNGTVTVTAQQNTGSTARTAIVTISATGAASQNVTVTQAAAATPTLSVSPTTLNLAAAANSSGTFNITSNTSWKDSSSQSWLTVSPATGSNNATVTVTAQQNTGSTSRTATVTISATGATTRTVTVTQAAATTAGGVWLEAECGTVGTLWNTTADANASSGTYVTIQSGNNSTSSAPSSATGWITLPFTISQTGTYSLWASVICPTPNDDSYWIKMDNGSFANWNSITNSSSWTWVKYSTTFNFSTTGSHTLTIGYREDGARLDKIYITSAGDTPSGLGSSAANCSSNLPPTSNAGPDQTVTDNDTSGAESVTLSGSGSSDPDGTITSYIWSENGNQIAVGVNPSVDLALGVHTITLTVIDNAGAKGTDNIIVTVNSIAAPTNQIWLEAECGTVGSLWNVTADANASGSTYVTIQSGNNSTSSAPASSTGWIVLPFSAGQAGTYYVWCRVITPTPNDDSFWLKMDNGSFIVWNSITNSSSWSWVRFQSFSLSAGSHTITVAYREDGTRLDKVYITSAGDTPSGVGSQAVNACTPALRKAENLKFGAEEKRILPTEYSLSQNYPNPFNPGTIIDYQIPNECFVTLKVYDVWGREIETLVNGVKLQGNHSVNFDASNLAAGVYIYSLRAGGKIYTKMMTLIK